jgi:DNA modification methylase
VTLTPHHQTPRVTVYGGDCIDVLAQLPPNSVHAIITDPPYGLEFMGKDWDKFSTGRSAKYAKGGDLNLEAIAERSGKGGAGPSYVNRPAKRCGNCGKQAWSGSPCQCDEPAWVMDNSPLHAFQAWCQEWATQCYRVLRPGGHLLAFGGTRTFHRLTTGIEDAGFEIRDSIAWLYGSGFPKSLDVSKAIDKAAGAQREVVGPSARHVGKTSQRLAGLNGSGTFAETPGMGSNVTAPATDAARQWHGWGTALKPAFEPIVVARKPLTGTVAANVQAWGTGALNIAACRVGTEPRTYGMGTPGANVERLRGGDGRDADNARAYAEANQGRESVSVTGRWPANVALDGPTADQLDATTGTLTSGANPTRRGSDKFRDTYGEFKGQEECTPARGADSGGPSRFYPVFRDPGESWPAWKYTPKAPTRERPSYVDPDGNAVAHATVKPVDLFAWLIRLVVPPDGTFIDPFAGSGASGEAATRERVNAILIEKDPTSLPLITARLHTHRPRRQAPPPAPGAAHQPDLFDHLNPGDPA